MQISHLNTNMGLQGVRDNFKNGLYGTLSFFTEQNPENIYKNSNIQNTIKPIIKIGGDILGFSEIFVKKQLEIIIDTLEKNGYNVYFTEAFDMWSQNIKGEKLYNVIGIKKGNNEKITLNTKVFNKRELAGKMIYLRNLLALGKGEKDSVIGNSRELYSRLANGILDGNITSFKIGDLNFSHLHIHSDNPEISKFFENHIKNKNHLMFGDFNIGNLDEFILKPPFSGKGYKNITTYPKTYSFTKGVEKLPLIERPDGVLNNSLNISRINTIKTESDHDGLLINLKE